MKLLFLTQNEHLYLPATLARVCQARAKDIVAVVVAPAMSTHGGIVKGAIRHLALFGLAGVARLGWRVLAAKIQNRFSRPKQAGAFFSLRAVAAAYGLPYHWMAKVNGSECQELVDRYEPDLLISLSCPQVIGKRLRDRFPMGCINVHGAPLPRYRGLMPAFWVLRNGETTTATTVHDLADRLDDGDILVQREVTISPQDTWDTLVRKTKAAGAEALVEAIDRIEKDTVDRRPNLDVEATYCSFPGSEDRKAFLGAGRRFF